MQKNSDKNNLGKYILYAIWLVLLIWGISGLIQRFASGRDAANYGSYMPWGLWVSAYIYFSGLSAGSFLLSSLYYVFGIKRLEGIGRLSLLIAVVTLLMGLLCILFDLGHMGRFYEVFTRPSFSSMMAWMVWLYTAYLILILGMLWLDLRCDLDRVAQKKEGLTSSLYRVLAIGWHCPETPKEIDACHRQSVSLNRILGAIGIPLTIAFSGGVGALFATLSSKPYWHTGLYPVLFLVGALLSGSAIILAVVGIIDIVTGKERKNIIKYLSRLVLGLLILYMLLEWAEFSIPMWYRVGPEFDLLTAVLFGQFWYVFWIVHILLGAVIPVILFIKNPTSRLTAILGGGLVAISFLAVRLNIVIPGQITPALEGLRDAYVDKRLLFHYVPSAFEWSVVAFVVAFGIALFYLGQKILPLRDLNQTETGGA
jgi:molybdopterin-containing oxidoreductase family membrane subunit